jgi:hypothetical protein
VPTVVATDIDLSHIERARAQIPCLQHCRPELF